MFKYELDQTIYYMLDNCIGSAPVTSRVCIENLHETWNSNESQRQLWQPKGNSGVYYYTCHGEVPEGAAFATARELADSLVKDSK